MHYSGTEGDRVVGWDKELVDGRLVGFEFETFYEDGGRVWLQPCPGGRPSPARFEATGIDAVRGVAVFENPGHDFPQRITYRLLARDHLEVRVEARDDAGGWRGFALDLRR